MCGLGSARAVARGASPALCGGWSWSWLQVGPHCAPLRLNPAVCAIAKSRLGRQGAPDGPSRHRAGKQLPGPFLTLGAGGWESGLIRGKPQVRGDARLHPVPPLASQRPPLPGPSLARGLRRGHGRSAGGGLLGGDLPYSWPPRRTSRFSIQKLSSSLKVYLDPR